MRIMLVMESGETGTGRPHFVGQESVTVDLASPTDVMARLAEHRYDAIIFHAPDRGLTQAFSNGDVIQAILTAGE